MKLNRRQKGGRGEQDYSIESTRRLADHFDLIVTLSTAIWIVYISFLYGIH
jgi:hypothetical protein